ncbi:MAG: guanylate kinase [Lachnospiraceae bacterium]|nr:guanylate kinase [Lachnospiraceae bacterium]
MSEGILVTVSGFSGSGKSTLMKELLKKYDQYAFSISATTRQPRPGERDGIEYFFKTLEEFQQMIAKDAFMEYVRYADNYYGTPKFYVEDQLANGKDVILEIEIEGAIEVKQKCPDTLLLFVAPPSVGELERRLLERGTETIESMQFRLARAVEESKKMKGYDYIVINDVLEDCVEQIHRIICSQRQLASKQIEFISQIQQELKRKIKDVTSVLQRID